ncbi:ERF family protein [Sphingopyxis witflariensis]|uniref:Uncharacterized protein n=1 Tax=Sphingopyxis witflariensis TaxID=173675 RepID=A0A246JY17_9SPHN|nr:ERF family protein [Sphingopyxis witflariensis]OWQ97984.1 hypothetical protein CDQ91_10210 [Sphingopyxis witflariensis]
MADLTPNYPPAVASAVIAVMRSLGTLAKGNENKFDKYDYASIDDFIHFVRGHCIAAGLFIEPNEAAEAKLVDVAKKDGKPMAMWWSRFAFYLVHESGERAGPIFKTVMVQANGAQAAGSAQSYAMKQFMRGQFMIPTGDADDPDKISVDISAQGQSETDLQRQAGRIRRSILTAQDLNELGLAWSDNSVNIDHIRRVSDTAYDFLVSEYEKRKTVLEADA